MTCGCVFVTDVLSSLCSSLIFSCGFTGSCGYVYDDVDDAMLVEHFDALGYDYSFQG